MPAYAPAADQGDEIWGMTACQQTAWAHQEELLEERRSSIHELPDIGLPWSGFLSMSASRLKGDLLIVNMLVTQ